MTASELDQEITDRTDALKEKYKDGLSVLYLYDLATVQMYAISQIVGILKEREKDGPR